jgi:hypothetical protein
MPELLLAPVQQQNMMFQCLPHNTNSEPISRSEVFDTRYLTNQFLRNLESLDVLNEKRHPPHHELHQMHGSQTAISQWQECVPLAADEVPAPTSVKYA